MWFDEWVIKPGDIISLKVDEGLEQSRVLLLCVSPLALASGWVALERSTAVHRDPSNVGRRFIPLLFADCELPDTLRRYKYLDFREESDLVFAKLLSTCIPEINFLPLASQSEVQKTEETYKPNTSEPFAILEHEFARHNTYVEAIAISADGSCFATGSRDGDIMLWDLKTHARRWRMNAMGNLSYLHIEYDSPPPQIMIAPDSDKLISASGATRILRVWDVDTGSQIHAGWQSLNVVTAAALFSDGKKVLAVNRKGSLGLWEISSGRLLRVFQHTGSQIESLAVSSTDKFAVYGDSAGRITVRSLDDSIDFENIWQGHAGKVSALKILRDGDILITGSIDKTIRIWDCDTGNCLGILEGHNGPICSLAVLSERQIVVSAGGSDRTVRFWDWKSGVCISVLTFETSNPMSVSFTVDGGQLIVGMSNGCTQLFRLSESFLFLLSETSCRYVNAKVVLLGEGTVGKTSLAYRLIDDEYVIKDRTHGMNVWRMELPIPLNATLVREVLLWDLAGQEDYRLIHQLFLEETALALLLINPQKDDPFVEAGEWLKALRTAANDQEVKRDPARLLIFSQIDVGGIKLSNAKIKRFCEQHGFAGWLPTSAKTGKNCSDKGNSGEPSRLKQLISASIPWEKLPWTSTPRLLAELKNAVMAMRDVSDIRLLRFAELAQRLEQALPSEKFVESDLRTVVTLLSNHGLVRPLKFGDLVLLRPDLINGYAGAVIRAARAHTDEIGCVLEADIYKADFDFTGIERLINRQDEELLLRALVQTFLDHSLCIAEETPHGRHLVFPSQYRREKDIPHEQDIFVSYTFSGEWQTVWTTLVVRLWYSQEFKHRELWRNAAEFESPRKQTLGLKVMKNGDGVATISLYFDYKVPDELKVIFIEYVHRHLAKYACDVTRDRRYVCQCGKPVKDLGEVQKRLNAGKDFITCQGCDEKVLLQDFIEQRLKSDPVAQRILAMDAVTIRELGNQALEQILIGHIMAIMGEANQIFRPVTMFDYGIDGEVEFRDNDGKPSGKKIYVQLKTGNSYLRIRKSDGNEVFDVKNDRHLDYWISQPVDVYLVIRQKEQISSDETIRWMNVTSYLKNRKDKKNRQIIFDGKKLDATAVWKVRDQFFP
ncbi:MAG: DUF4365 domain-containing protein [Geobacteraceae bacterium]|nr:DUF4365 domain-containing protein [Geobacteraceae bacterium]